MGVLCLLGIAYAQRLSPGDRIRLICEQEPTLSIERMLSPEGDVELPLLGRVNLAGKYLVEAEAELRDLAAVRLQRDGISIVITLVSTPLGPIEFLGAIARNGTMPFRQGMTLDDIVKIAQPGEGAAIEAVEITGADGHKLVVDLENGGGSTKLRAGDRVFFPRAEYSNDVFILGAVAKPGRKKFESRMTLRSLLALAGGTTGHALSSKVLFARKGQEPRIIDLTATDLDLKILRGDVITVPMQENGRYVTVSGFVKHPGVQELAEGMKLSEAIKAAGGLGPFANGDSITVQRLGMWKRTFNYRSVLAGKEEDLVLGSADIVDVPAIRPKAAPPKATDPKKPRSHPVVPPR